MNILCQAADNENPTLTMDPEETQPVSATKPSESYKDIKSLSTKLKIWCYKLRTNNSDTRPPPDGGCAAWFQCGLCHLAIFNTWGYINSYGIFQTYYSTTLGLPPATISWIGSLQIFLLFFIGTWSGRATDAGKFECLRVPVCSP